MCCSNDLFSRGCVYKEEHEPEDHAPGVHERYWLLHPTPVEPTEDLPKTKGSSMTYRKAVALDCEMGTAWNSEPELIRLTLIDYFTSEKLIDSLIFPNTKMITYNTRWSGVTRNMMTDAHRKGLCIMGFDAARANVWKFVGPDTVVMMHGGVSDMISLRWIHKHIIDTGILENWKKVPHKGASLKYLASEMLARDIQKGTHSSYEDAMACRDLVAWYMSHSDELK